MDWSAIGLVLAGGVLSVTGQWINRRWGKTDKLADRRDALVDKHESDIRTAYGDFIAASTTFVDKGIIVASVELAIAQVQDEAYDARMMINGGHPTPVREEDAHAAAKVAVSKDLIMRSRQAHEELLATGSVAGAKAVAVLLLETDQARQDLIRAIGINTFVLPTGSDERAAFAADMQHRRRLLIELMQHLSGAFAPPGARSLGPGPRTQLAPPPSNERAILPPAGRPELPPAGSLHLHSADKPTGHEGQL